MRRKKLTETKKKEERMPTGISDSFRRSVNGRREGRPAKQRSEGQMKARTKIEKIEK